MPKSFTFNGMSSENFNIIVDQPTVSFAKRKVYSSSVTGMNGNYYDFQNAWEEKIIAYKILAGNNTSTNYQIFIQIAEWLNDTNGYAILTDSFDPEHYHLAVCIDGMDAVMALQHYGKATITFRCKPERYLITESIEVTSGDSIDNPTNHNAYPLITLTGGGARSQINLTSKALASNAGDYTSLSAIVPYKDTAVWSATGRSASEIRLFDTTSYTSNISNANGSIQLTTPNTGGTGRGIGLLQSVQADSDYTLSLDMYVVDAVYDEEEETSTVAIYFVGATGNNNIIGFKNIVDDESRGWKHMRLTFHTPTECGYIFVIIQNPFALDRTIQAKNIMLNGGKTERTFRPYDDSSTSQIQINDIILEFTINGYDTAVIDCEKENVTIDGVNGNPNSMLTDQYGNLSVSYLQMLTGVNTITYSGDITAVSVEPRFWEL